MIKLLTSLIVAISFSTHAFAHSKLETSHPKEGSILEALPTEISLFFNRKIRLTKVVLISLDKDEVKFDLDDYKNFQTDFSLALPQANAHSGHYIIEWRGLGEDGHVMKGKLTYTVK